MGWLQDEENYKITADICLPFRRKDIFTMNMTCLDEAKTRPVAKNFFDLVLNDCMDSAQFFDDAWHPNDVINSHGYVSPVSTDQSY